MNALSSIATLCLERTLDSWFFSIPAGEMCRHQTENRCQASLFSVRYHQSATGMGFPLLILGRGGDK